VSEVASARVVRVLVVDDSAVSLELLTGVLNADAQLQVVGVASDGEAAVAAAQRLKPDLVTMDIHLPKMDGYAATRRIMELCPTRVVMVTASVSPTAVEAAFRALECGALTVIAKPPGPGHPMFTAASEELRRTVKLMAEVRVVKRRAPAGLPAHKGPAVAPIPERDVRLVAIGASTGGPLALQAILSRLRPGFGAPIAIVQHNSAGFAEGFAQWLAHASGHAVRVATQAESMRPGIAYIAPDGVQMRVAASGRIVLVDESPEHGYRPSVSSLFRSAAAEYGPLAVGVLLTGMGRDGAQELETMRRCGALTIAQSKDSAVVNGMPGEAVKLGAATHVLAPEAIASTLNRLLA